MKMRNPYVYIYIYRYFKVDGSHSCFFCIPQEMESKENEAHQPQVPACRGGIHGGKNSLCFFFTGFTECDSNETNIFRK